MLVKESVISDTPVGYIAGTPESNHSRFIDSFDNFVYTFPPDIPLGGQHLNQIRENKQESLFCPTLNALKIGVSG